jgi:hypothetical protein
MIFLQVLNLQGNRFLSKEFFNIQNIEKIT